MAQSKSQKQVAIIGSGFSGLSAAAYLSKAGYKVDIYEKNNTIGGRARNFTTKEGFTFDMGPSWYWMPDIFDDFFSDFDCHSSDFYQLVSLDPQFEIVFEDNIIALPSNFEDMKILFEHIEVGAASALERFMREAEEKYNISMTDYVQKPCHSWLEFFTIKIATSALKLDLFTNFKTYVRRYFSHPKLIYIMEFPVIFLGAMPDKIPAMYSLMNFGGYRLGTWYPMGGFYEVVKAMAHISENNGASIFVNSEVSKIVTENNSVSGIIVNNEYRSYDLVISSADYHHTEQHLLNENYHNYKEESWKKRTFAPSCLIYYLGFNKKIKNIKHHTLFFENDFYQHAEEIYHDKKWPSKPLFYVCCPSQTDASVAPVGHENLFLLMPIATGIKDDHEKRDIYFNQMIARLEAKTGESGLLDQLIYKKSYCVNDFINDYNAYQGNAYGLANTLNQTAVLKPAVRNKKLKNLFYTGQLTVPGPGVPPAIISGKIAATEALKLLNQI